MGEQETSEGNRDGGHDFAVPGLGSIECKALLVWISTLPRSRSQLTTDSSLMAFPDGCHMHWAASLLSRLLSRAREQ
jgi:hypothetical protein